MQYERVIYKLHIHIKMQIIMYIYISISGTNREVPKGGV